MRVDGIVATGNHRVQVFESFLVAARMELHIAGLFEAV